METPRILWADDEIDRLKPQILFLEQKGMAVHSVTNGQDAIEAVKEERFDVIFLDENMPGLSGLETLAEIKNIVPHTPVVMITKSEEEDLMEDAIGSRIADYLIKPVNPKQILSSLKKLLKGRQLVSQKLTTDYQQDFRQIAMAFFDADTMDEWAELYRKLVRWELELEDSSDTSMQEVLTSQKAEANVNFGKFIAKHYLNWCQAKPEDRPLLSVDVLSQHVKPHLKAGKEPVIVLLVDALRYDQWQLWIPQLTGDFNILRDELYCSILPTATQYARNSLFSGLWPIDIAKKYPDYWVYDEEDRGKNLFEKELLQEWLGRNGLHDKRLAYHKIIRNEEGHQLANEFTNLLDNDLSVVVVNFIDIMTHARAELELVKSLAPDEEAFRDLARSWLEHNWLLEGLRKLAGRNCRILLTTDHGSVLVRRPVKIIGDRNTTTNLRYKHGRNLNYDEKERLIFSVKDPAQARLPKSNVSGTYAFAQEDAYFVYPNNYNKYASQYKETFQHGGISLEEMLVPLVHLSPKS